MIATEKNTIEKRVMHPNKIANTQKYKEQISIIESTTDNLMKYFDQNENPRISEIKNRIYDFKHLKDNWDSYHAEKISEGSIIFAIQLIMILELNNITVDEAFPMRDGGVQIEKDDGNASIEIEISPDYKITLLVFDRKSDLKFEAVYEIKNIAKLLDKLKVKYEQLHD